jgi:hypothetical protein
LSEVKTAIVRFIAFVLANTKLTKLIHEKQELTDEVVEGLEKALASVKKDFSLQK